jgi:hypothetical protein
VDPTRTYFLGNRLWWSVALSVGPIVGAITGGVIGVVAATALLVLPSFVLFDTDRRWWPDEVRRLPQDPERTRSELRKLTLWSGIALLAGVAIAFLRPWT